jgi:hypothetical protein
MGVLMFRESATEGLIVIDYVACREGRLQSLLFSKLLAQLQARVTSTGIPSVAFEIQDPAALTGQERAHAAARLRRFERLGARSVGDLRYLAPNMDEFGMANEETPYLLMHVSNGISPTNLTGVQRIVHFLYTVWYRNWFSRSYAGREAELQTYVDTLYERVAGTLPERCRLPTRSSRQP